MYIISLPIWHRQKLKDFLPIERGAPLFLAVFATFFASSYVNGEIVRYVANASISLEQGFVVRPTQWSIGDPVQIEFAYDTSPVDTDSDPERGNYRDAVVSFKFNVNQGAYIAVFEDRGFVSIGDTEPNDFFAMSGDMTAPSIPYNGGSLNAKSASISFFGIPSVLDNDFLAPLPPFASWAAEPSFNEVAYLNFDGNISRRLVLNISDYRLVAVPEPSSIVSLLLISLWVGGCKIKRARAVVPDNGLGRSKQQVSAFRFARYY